MNNRTSSIKRLVVYATLACMVAEPAFAATTDISNVPLSSGTSPLPPNVMFILDDSGSMARDFLPDYVAASGGGVAALATTRGLNGKLDCVSGDPCYYTGGANGFNGLYYDPNVNYKPGVNYDGTTVQPATLSTTSLEPDAYLGGTNVNLTNNTVSQDRVFCNGANLICKRNGADNSGVLLASGGIDADSNIGSTTFTMGAGQFPYRAHKTNSSSQSFGLPEMLPLATFTRSTTVVTATTPVAHGLAVNDRVVVYGTGISSMDRIIATVATVGSTTTFTYTSPTSGTQPAAIAVTASKNNGTVTVNSNGHGLIDGELITVTGGGSNFNVTGARVTVTGSNAFQYDLSGSNVGNTAISYQRAVITGSFRKYTSASWTRSGSNVTVSSTAHGLAVNDVISIQTGDTNHNRVAVAVSSVAANSFQYNTANTGGTSGSSANTFWARIPPFGPFAGTWSRSSNTVTVTSNGHGLTSGDLISVDADNDNEDKSSAAVTVTNANIFTYTGTNSGSTSGNLTWATLNGLYNDPDSNVTRNPIVFRITPVEYCSDANLTTCALATTPGTAPAGFLIPAYVRFCKTLGDATAPGVVTGNSGSPATARCISKFIDSGTTYTYARFGLFSRENIVSTTASYTNRPTRNDCTSPGAPTCSYAEEIQNYARWYTYYRTRINTMKTAGGRAFQSFTHNPAATPAQFTKLRVGFITINAQRDGNQGVTTNVQPIRYLKINDFAGNGASSHAANWYTKFYAIGQGSGVTELVGMTPLREALSRVGWIFAGKMGTGLTSGLTQANDDPVQVSCQRNFAVLTTDGYWNNNVGKKLNNTDMDNQDNDNSGTALVVGGVTYDQPASSRAQGTYDGNLLSGTVAGASPGGSGTLADVALYYYKTDLRGGTTPHTGPATNGAGVDVSANNVPTKPGAKNFVTHQHMVTFAIGMVDGLMRYQTDYETSTSGDFANIKNAAAAGTCLWTTGTCDWPSPRDDSAGALDDLWHAAVNGRGTYYSGRDTAALVAGLESTLNALNLQVAAAAASSTSSPNITQTDRQIFSTTYETDTWSGRIVAQNIDPNTGNVEPAILWQADTQFVATPLTVPGRVDTASDTRTIKTFCTGAAPCTSAKLKDFTWANLNATEQAYFTDKCNSNPTNLRQCTQITGGPSQANVNDGSKMVGYLRGWTGLELNADLSVGSFRDRKFIDPGSGVVSQTVLGDTINAKPAFVRNPILQYADTGYAAHKGTYAGRSPRLFVGANDGYLHSFHGDTGAEVWAYLPRFLMSGLFVLADSDYKNRHTYFADGSPETADVYDITSTSWKTILVAGVNNGGRGYYALDVTDPNNPKGLWEFCTDSTICPVSNANLGYTYGNPVIGKRSSDGKWVVVVTSGVNNVGSGDGKGYFYVLDAITGAILNTVATNVGDTTTPSGLAKIAGFYDNAVTDATFRYVYGGDQLGNVWRLDFNAVGGATAPVLLHLATLKDGAGKLQPITTKPVLTTISGNKVLYIGTGRYLGNKDLSNPATQVPPDTTTAWQQTLYAFKDKSTDYGTDIRSGATLVTQTLSALTATTRTTSTNPVAWGSTGDDGWLMDFNPANSSPGERVNIDPDLVLGTLIVTTNVPIASTGGASCTIGGDSWQYQLDFKSGSFLSTSTGQVAGQKTGSVVTVGVAVVQLPSGAIKSIVTGADTSKSTITINLGAGAGTVRRFSYRER